VITWDPAQYSRFADDRARPFFDLVGRIHVSRPRRVVDLGCGPGNLTATLVQRWPNAHVLGIDSSAEMVRVARPGDRLSFELGDINTYQAHGDVDVLISNAALHWVPEHLRLLRSWAGALPLGAWMAWQVPGNFQAASHRLLLELAGSPRWSRRLADVPRFDRVVVPAAEYADLLLNAGWSADAWETTYQHVLNGPDAVLEWVRGTTLGPIRAVLHPDESEEFEEQYAELLREAYPPRSGGGTLYAFRRIFVVGHKS
jgi:trans-aconitate 2-methyltransferase